MRKDKISTNSTTAAVTQQVVANEPEKPKRKIMVGYIRPENDRVKRLYEQEAREKEEKERQKQTEVNQIYHHRKIKRTYFNRFKKPRK